MLLNPDGSPMSMHYEALGVSEDASLDELRQAWRVAARRWHPDHRGVNAQVNAQATELFKMASDAWAVLRDVDLRAEYDEALRVARMPTCSVCGKPSFQSTCALCSLTAAPSAPRAGTEANRGRSTRPRAKPVTPNPPPRAKPKRPARPNPPPRPPDAEAVYPAPGFVGPGFSGAGAGYGSRVTPGDAWDAAERDLFEREAREREVQEELERELAEREAAIRDSASFLASLVGGKSRTKSRKKPVSLEVPLGPGFRVVIDSEVTEHMGDVNDGLRLANRLFRSVSKLWK